MLKPIPLCIRPKDVGSDVIKFVRQHYISSNGERERQDGHKVLKRSKKTYATELVPDWWDRRYKRTQYNFTCGAFSLPQYPYKSLGDVVLDTNELVIDALSGNLPANFKRMYKKTDKDRHTDLATSWANVSTKESKAKHPRGAGLYFSRQMEFNTAGMKQLKALLRESSLRIIATRGGQNYIDHVENCHKVKKNKLREQEEAETPGMVLRKLSSQTIFDNAVPVQTEYMKTTKLGRSAARKLRKLTQNVMWIRHKLIAIYQVLSALTNMKPKYLRGKQPLKTGILKTLFRDPFAVDPLAGKAPPRHALQRQENLQRSKESPVSQADGGSAAGESTTRTGKDSSQSHRLSMSTQSSFHLQHQASSINPQQGVRINFDRITGGQGKASTARRKTRTRVHTNQYEDGSARLEGWEDLLNLGVKNKQLRVQKPKQPPWQMLANMCDDGEINVVTMKKAASRREGSNQIVNEDAERVVSRAQQNFMNLKKKIYKNISHEIERLDRQRLAKYQYKMRVLDTLLPLFVDQQQLISDVGQSAAMENVHTDKATKWFSILTKEVDSVTQSGITHAFENNIDLNKCLKRLENFRKDEITLIPNVKEKLCLLTLSIPAYELCTMYMQNAIKFVLEEILHTNVSLLNDWLDYRGLPHFYT